MSQLQNRYHVEELRPIANEHALLGLFRESFGENVEHRDFLWKYGGGPDGPMRTWAAIDDSNGEIVGAYSAFPRSFELAGVPVLAYQRADSMVLPSHRRQGLFQRLLSAMNDALRDESVAFQFGYSNDRSAAAIRKRSDGHECMISRTLALPVGLENFGRAIGIRGMMASLVDLSVGWLPNLRARALVKLAGPPLSMIPIETDASIALACDDIHDWNRTLTKGARLLPIRSTNFMRWKVFESPAYRDGSLRMYSLHDGCTEGYVVLYHETSRNLLKIIDLSLQPASRGLYTRLTAALISHAISAGVDAIVCNVVCDEHAEGLRSAGFFERARARMTYFPLLAQAPIPRNQFDSSFIFQTAIDRDHWYY